MQPNPENRDLTQTVPSFLLHWGIPIAAMVAAIWLPAAFKPPIWSAALIWMGVACLRNARHCGRVHCYFTGPFFLFMVVPVLLHGYRLVWLGPEGWKWLGLAIGIGGGGLWCLTEHFWGRYRNRP